MAFADGNIIIGTSVDVGGIDTGLHKIQKSFRKLGRLAITTVGIGAFYKIGKAAIDAASDLQEVQNVVDVAFKDMSYKIEEFSKICIEHFGISEFAAKQTSGSFMAMAKAIGITKEMASDMAVELTGLTGDFASFYNISQEYARVAISAIFTGETETIKRYGIILTEANLQEYALTIGIEKKVKAMSAAEKALLRYNYVMERTEMLHGDFERTQNNWANSVRVLKEQWHVLMVEMGTIFMQKVQPVVTLLNTIITKLIAIFQYLQALLGITSEIGDATFADEMEEMADAVDDVGTAIKHQLAPFDKLNNLTSKASGGVDDDLSDLEKLYAQAKLSGYVIDAMKNFEVQVTELSDTIKEKLKNIVNLFRRAKFQIEQVWNNIKLSHWFSAGMSFGNLIASLESFISDSISKVKWQEKGEQIGNFLKGIIWSDALGGWVDVLTNALDGIVTLAISAMDKITLSDILQLSKKYSKAAKKFLLWITNTLKRVDWEGVGKKIGTFIENIDWEGVFTLTVSAIFEALKSAIRFYKGMFDGSPLITALVTGIVAALKLAKWTGFSDTITDSLKSAIKEWKKTDGPAKAFSGALGVVSIGLSVAIAVNKWEKIKKADIDANSLKARLQDLGSAIGAAFGVKLLASAFGIAMGPAGVLLTFAGVLALNIALDYALEPADSVKEAKARSELEEAINSVDWVSQINDTIDVLVNLKVNAEGRIDEVVGDMDYYRDMAKTWEELSSRYDELTEGEKKLVKLYSEQMITKFPEVAESVDTLTGAYIGAKDALDLLIQKSEDYLKLQAYSELKEDAYKKKYSAELDLEQFNQRRFQMEQEKENIDDYIVYMLKLNTSEDKLKELWEKYGLTSMKTNDDLFRSLIRPIKLALQKGKLSWEGFDFRTWAYHSFDDLLPEGWQNVWGLFNGSKILTDKAIEYNNAVNAAGDALAYFDIQISELANELAKEELLTSLNKLKEAFSTTFENLDTTWSKDIGDAITAIETKLENGEEVTKEDMAKLFIAINKGFTNLAGGDLPKDLQITLSNLRNQLLNGEIEFSDAMKVLAGAMTDGFSEGLSDPNKKSGIFKILDEQKEKILKAIGSWKSDATNAMKKSVLQGMYDATTKKVEQDYYDSLSASDKLKYSGAHKSFQEFGYNALVGAMEGTAGKDGADVKGSLIDGMTTITSTDKKDLETGGATMSTTVIDGSKDAAKINSPSKVMRDEVAGGMIEGMVDGLRNGVDALVRAASEVVNAVVSTFESIKLTPTLTIAPSVDLANAHIPDIVNGMVIPSQVSGGVSVNNSIVGMSKQELADVLYNTLSNIALGVNLEGDSASMFKAVQKEARIYTNRTHEPAFG